MKESFSYPKSFKNNFNESAVFIYSPVNQRTSSHSKHLFLPIIRTIFSIILLIIICKITHFIQKILYDVRINGKCLHHLLITCLIFILIYFYLLFKLKILRPENRKVAVDKWDKVAPVPMFFCSFLLVYGSILFIVGLWPAFHIMSFILLHSFFACLIHIFQWIPI